MRVLTIDLGTGRLKVCLWKDGRLVARVSESIETHLDTDRVEQDPKSWWAATVRLVRRMVEDQPAARTVAAIGLTGHMHALVPTDIAGQPLGPVAVVPDRRARLACREFDDAFGVDTILRWTGGRLDPTCALAKARHFRQSGDSFWRTARWLLPPKDFLRMQLTGEAATDPIDAAGTMLWDIKREQWHAQLAHFAGCSLESLPPVRPTVAVAGVLCEQTAAALGLSNGIPVAMGGGDDIETLGAGVFRPGDIQEHLGTTGSLYVATAEPVFDPEGRVETYPDVVPGRWLAGGSTSAAGLAQRWMLDLLGLPEAWAEMEHVFARMAAGHLSDVLFLPYLAGERAPLWNVDRTGALLGLRTDHKQQDILQATVEGVLFSLRSVLAVLEELGVAPVTSRVHTAGPFGAEPELGSARANTYGRTVVRYGDSESNTSFAAMVLASCAITGENPYEMASHLLPQRWSVDPRVDKLETYDRAYERFQEATRALAVLDRPRSKPTGDTT